MPAAVLGPADFFPIDGDHPPGGSVGVCFPGAGLHPVVDHGIQHVWVKAPDDPVESGQRRDPGAQREPLSGRGFLRPFGDHCQRRGAGDHRAHNDVQHVQERVTNPSPVARIRHHRQCLSQRTGTRDAFGGAMTGNGLRGHVACQGIREGR